MRTSPNVPRRVMSPVPISPPSVHVQMPYVNSSGLYSHVDSPLSAYHESVSRFVTANPVAWSGCQAWRNGLSRASAATVQSNCSWLPNVPLVASSERCATSGNIVEIRRAEYSAGTSVISGQSRTAIRAAEITAQKLAAVRDGLDVRLVINDFDVSLANLGVRAGLLEMIDECSVRCVGVYPHDDRLPAAQDKGVLLGEGITSVAARNTAARLLGDSVPLFRGLDRLRSKIRL